MEKEKQNIVIFMDIDGVIANIEKRLPYVQHKDKKNNEYDKFYGPEMADDELIAPTADLLYSIFKTLNFDFKEKLATHIVAITGRPKRTATLTKLWMRENCFELTSFIDEWVFRPDRDWTPSSNFKARKVEEIMAKMHNLWGQDGDWCAIIIDDDPTNVASMEGKIRRNHPDDHVIALTVGTKQFVKLMTPPAFTCKTSGFENCTSCGEECACRSSHQCQK